MKRLSLLLACVFVFVFSLNPTSGQYKRNYPNDHQTQPTNSVDRDGDEVDNTPYERMRTTGLISGWEIRPSPGLSVFRDISDTAGTGSITEDGGDFLVASGSTSGGTAVLQTKRRGLYQSGQVLTGGNGIIIEDTPSGDGVARFGYFDDENGFGYGVDDTGLFVFYRRAGVDTTVYRENWNIDVLDGSKSDTNPSELKHNIGDGSIYKIELLWYAIADVTLFLQVSDGSKRYRTPVHRFNFEGKTSTDDPNQPIRVEVNNKTTNDNIQIRVGGRNVRDGTKQNKRTPPEPFLNFTVSSNQQWVPLCTMRKKSTFNGRPNSVRVAFRVADALSVDESSAYRITYTDTTSASFSDPTGWPSTETAVEVSCNPGNFTTGGNIPIDYFFVGSGKNDGGQVESDERVIMDGERSIVLWVRDLDTDGTNPIVSGDIQWTEFW